jgi:type IV pilus assembly protein PilV
MKTSRIQIRGIGLFDALVALAILSFGLLAMTRFQTRMVAQATDAQTRLTASQFADELLNTALVDAGQASCYTVPQVGTCASTAASSVTGGWKTRTLAALPSGSASSVLSGNRLTVTLSWAGKSGATTNGASDTHRVEVTTDVTP